MGRRYLDSSGEAVDGVAEIRQRLQRVLDERVAELDGTHFDLPAPVKTVEAWIAPPGSAAAPYYTRPSRDFSRPGRTWLPVMGQTRFPLWKLVSTWHHEGVPGHHLQLGTWTALAGQLSTYQTTISVSAMTEGWALYAERLMDELGYLSDPGARLGYLEAQLRRAIRVIVDIGLHLRLELPPGVLPDRERRRTWTPELAVEFFAAHTARSTEFATSEIVRYLGRPGQAIGYKVGERAWLAGRGAARAAPRRRIRPEVLAHGRPFARRSRSGRPHHRAGAALTVRRSPVPAQTASRLKPSDQKAALDRWA